MFVKQDFNLIVTIVDKGFSDPVIAASKTAGAEGATIITARGAGIHENDTFLGVAIQPEKEIVLILVKKAIRKKVMREICKTCGLTDEGKGMTFSIPVDEIGGINHLMSLSKGRHTLRQAASKTKTSTKGEKEKKTTEIEKKETPKTEKEQTKPEKAEKVADSKKETTKTESKDDKKGDDIPVKDTKTAKENDKIE